MLIPADLCGTRQLFSKLPGYLSCMRSPPKNVSELYCSKVCAIEGGLGCLFPRWCWEGASRDMSKARELDWRGQAGPGVAERCRGGQPEPPLVEILGDGRDGVSGPATMGTNIARAPAPQWVRMAPATPRFRGVCLSYPPLNERKRSQEYACLSTGQKSGP